MVLRVAILGASGFVGGELLRLCADHKLLEPVLLTGENHAGSHVGDVHPHLAIAYSKETITRFDPEALEQVDFVLAALPHGHSQKLAHDILERGLAFVDLGADFRLRDVQTYERWYGEVHHAPDLLEHFVYGIPEINREAIRSARCVSAAGCFPTATVLALKPLIDAGLIDTKGIIVDAASGVSGAGRMLKESTAFATVSGSLTAYGLLSHRHTAEMEANLGAQILFTPHLAPINRGILATCYATATRQMAAEAPLDALRAAYSGESFVHVTDAPPATKWTLGSNAVHITARYDERTGRVLAIAALDNLVKGAAGQMIQCANLMLGFDETEGLTACGVYP